MGFKIHSSPGCHGSGTEFGTCCWDLNHGGGEWEEEMGRRWGERKQRRSWQAREGLGHKRVWESRTPREEVGGLAGPTVGDPQVGWG